MRLEDLQEGLQLVTKDSQRHTNAVYLGKNKANKHVIISDYGNLMTMPFEQLVRKYTLTTDYYEALSYEIDPLVIGVKERLENQVELLATHLEHHESYTT